jgi:hypothetical protein
MTPVSAQLYYHRPSRLWWAVASSHEQGAALRPDEPIEGFGPAEITPEEAAAFFRWSSIEPPRHLAVLPPPPGDSPTSCERDCIEVIRVAGHNLKRNEVLEALASAGKEHGTSTVRNALSRLCKPDVGLLTPPGKGRGSVGYGLPEWSNSL